LGERMVMWIFGSYFKGCVKLWSQREILRGAAPRKLD